MVYDTKNERDKRLIASLRGFMQIGFGKFGNVCIQDALWCNLRQIRGIIDKETENKKPSKF